ncbi:MAG TPA: hypothetical protein PLU66_04320 [Trueperaceae bacterium]|nr:hypothetical protein [Trueperaceae bacterium]HRQ11154.1 hypothetical protein [Trueperaceae bacterium]
MKKKFALGCLIVAIAVIVVGGGAAYFYVIRPLTNTVKAATELGRISEIEGGVKNKRSFAAPSDGELKASDVERYLSVTRAVSAGLKGKAEELQTKYSQLVDDDRNPSVRQVIDAYADIIRLVVQAKELQVKALNAEGFSLAEYSWVRREVYQAAGLGYHALDLTALSEGEVDEDQDTVLPEAPPKNVELVAPHTDELNEYMPLAVFGL